MYPLASQYVKLKVMIFKDGLMKQVDIEYNVYLQLKKEEELIPVQLQ